MQPHRIRLRDPWEVLPNDDGGTVRRRAFNKPTGLEPGDVVQLVIDDPIGVILVTVNESLMFSPPCGVAVDITSVLRARNFVELKLKPGGSCGEVRLEIDAAENT
jgi:hypothetical protein